MPPHTHCTFDQRSRVYKKYHRVILLVRPIMASIGFFPHDAAWGLYIKFSMLITAGTETFIKLLLLWKHNSQSLMQQKKPKMVPITEQVNNQHCTFKRGGGDVRSVQIPRMQHMLFSSQICCTSRHGGLHFFYIYIYLYYELI